VRYKRKAIDTQQYGRPCLNSAGYLQVYNTHTKKKEYLHRVIWEELNSSIPGDLTIDHINNNKLDNRIENLQLLTRSANVQRNRSGAAFQRKPGRWEAYRGHKYVGTFGTKCGALMAARISEI